MEDTADLNGAASLADELLFLPTTVCLPDLIAFIGAGIFAGAAFFAGAAVFAGAVFFAITATLAADRDADLLLAGVFEGAAGADFFNGACAFTDGFDALTGVFFFDDLATEEPLASRKYPGLPKPRPKFINNTVNCGRLSS